jgi:hypothetical protein
MKRKIKFIIAATASTGIIFFIYMAAQLTKLKDSDILNISEDEEDWF